MALIQITAHEHAKGPQGFPTVTYDLAVGPMFVTGANANQAIEYLADAGMSPNQARRSLHDARDARAAYLARDRANQSIKIDLYGRAVA